MSNPQLPNLTHIASRMAANQAKVSQYAEALMGRLDELVAAWAGRIL